MRDLTGLESAVDSLGQSVSALDVWADVESSAGTLTGHEVCEVGNAVYLLKQILDALREVSEARRVRLATEAASRETRASAE